MLGLATVALTVAASDVPPYAGLQNQGNTCYMNSLLQSLCHVPGFARAVYELPAPLPPPQVSESVSTGTASKSGSTGTRGGAAESSAVQSAIGSADSGASDAKAEDLAIAHEMQRLLYQLGRAPSLGKVYVGTQRLTRALGMSPRDVLVQQDAQEFWQRLYAALAAVGRGHRRKGAPPPAPTRLGCLFQGTTLNYVRCTRVPFRSERQGRFCDVQLQVAGCRSLGASLQRFTAEETLDGEYNTKDERYGRQPAGTARRGCAFRSLPPVLQLHLKRFEYDTATGEMRKLDDLFAFPTTLKLRRFMVKGVLAKGDPPPTYELRAVLSHQGGVGAGHYFSFVRPVGSRGEWYKFDDTRVYRVPEEAAVAHQFGGGTPNTGRGLFGLASETPSPCAYMLTYVRQAEVRAAEAAVESSHAAGAAGGPAVLGGAPAAEAEALPDELREAFEAEIAQKRRRRS